MQVYPHPRAQRVTFRALPGGEMRVTVPWGLSQREFQDALERMRPRLRRLVAKQQPYPLLQPGYRWQSGRVEIRIEPGRLPRLMLHSEPGIVSVAVPPAMECSGQQELLRKAVMRGLQHQGRLYLPQRLAALATQVGASYTKVAISCSRSRWGSCSNQGHISLSCFLMLLPDPLIDYVLLHELAHTHEMNHSPRFWAWLDRWTEGDSQTLREELKGFTHPF